MRRVYSRKPTLSRRVRRGLSSRSSPRYRNAMADTPVTAQSILTSFLLSSTSFTTPSLTSLRSLAPTQSTDSQLKQWHREVLQHRNSLRGQVEEEIKAYKLVPKGLVRQVKRELKVKEEEEALDEGEEGERLSLGEAIARLEKEEKLLGVEVQDVQDGIEQRKRTLDA